MSRPRGEFQHRLPLSWRNHRLNTQGTSKPLPSHLPHSLGLGGRSPLRPPNPLFLEPHSSWPDMASPPPPDQLPPRRPRPKSRPPLSEEAGSVAQGLIHRHPPPAIQATRRLHMAPCAKRDAQRVPRQLGVSMGARAADPRCAADPHAFSPASAAAFLRATSRVGRSIWW